MCKYSAYVRLSWCVHCSIDHLPRGVEKSRKVLKSLVLFLGDEYGSAQDGTPRWGPRNNHVKELRLELGLTRVELAKLADLSEKTVDRAERGTKDLRETTYRRIFNALNKARARESLRALMYRDLFP